MSSRKEISLVLGSGGARGYAHIGAIEEIVKAGYTICSISGSSMGSLIGGLYACGKLELYKEWILGLDVFDVVKLLDFSFTRGGLLLGEKVIAVIEQMIGDVLIEDLPMPYTAVATDLNRQKEVWLQKGRLIDAIRASIAIPTIFTPKIIDKMTLVDGGVLNPLPIAPTLADTTDMTIAVSLNGIDATFTPLVPKHEKEKEKKVKNLFFQKLQEREKLFFSSKVETSMDMLDVMGKSIDVMQNTILNYKIAGNRADILIEIANDASGFYEFNRAYELIELGRIITREKLALASIK